MRVASFILLAALLPAVAVAQQPTDNLPYEVAVTGIDDQDLAGAINDASRLIGLKDKPPPGLIALDQRADDDRQRLAEVMRSQGYYDGRLDIAVDGDQHPVKVAITVEQGPRTSLTAWSTEPPQGIGPGDVGLSLGQPAVAADVVKAETRLLSLLAERAHPLAKVQERQVVVDHATHGMTVVEQVDIGPWARFGPATIAGLATIDPSYVRHRIPWQEGEAFSPPLVERLRKSLSESGLFRTIRISTGEQADPEGRLPITIDLTERASRSVGAGVLYSTDVGPGLQTFWENRNVFGGAEDLRVTGAVSRARQLALADYRAPDYFGIDRDFVADLLLDQESTEAFFSRTASISAGMDWRVSPIWRLGAAGALEHTLDHESGDPVGHYELFSVPLQARRDTSNSLLDPSEGGRTTLTARPFVSITGESSPFTQLEAKQDLYTLLLDDPRMVLAAWGDAGAFINGARVDIPPDKRFYAGGGGSVRGYRLRYAGPLDDQGRPEGGRSLLGAGLELRANVTKSFALVPFLEGADVFPDAWPRFTGRWFSGTGLGFRYDTGIGPLRLDFAVPLYRRPGVDDAYQIYVSLGQAF